MRVSKQPESREIPWGLQRNKLEGRASVRELAWGADADDFGPQFDLVLGSDLIYQLEALPCLFKTIRGFSGPGTKTLLSLELRPLVVEAARKQAAAAGLILRQARSPPRLLGLVGPVIPFLGGVCGSLALVGFGFPCLVGLGLSPWWGWVSFPQGLQCQGGGFAVLHAFVSKGN